MDIAKFKFATKASLSLAIVTVVTFWQGWEGLSSAIVTIMVIASYGSLGDSIQKGILRIAGTILGTALGMILIAIFPQDREIYLILLSLLVALSFYLSRAYRGDGTIFMLIGLTMMILFQDGDAEYSFVYGMQKSYMTIFGIAVYTLVGVYILPDKKNSNTLKSLIILNQKQQEFFYSHIVDNREGLDWEDLINAEESVKSTRIDEDYDLSQEFDDSKWGSIISHNHKINNQLILISQNRSIDVEHIEGFIINYRDVTTCIDKLLISIESAWRDKKEVDIPVQPSISYEIARLEELPHIQRASIITRGRHLQKLLNELIELSKKINISLSPYPTIFDTDNREEVSKFLWFDMEDIKGTLVSFLIFWVSTLIWIEFHPPGGFILVTLATTMSLYTTFSILKPTTMMIAFTISFIFAIFSYIFILPHLHYGWELFIFIFLYGMIGFYIMPQSLSVIFLLGLATFNLSNEMSYNFDIFLLILLIFYLYLSILLVAYYIPFSTRAEDMFLLLKKRFFNISKESINLSRDRYSKHHLIPTVKKMKLWATQIDSIYFQIDSDKLFKFTKECEKLGYLILLDLNISQKHDKSKLFDDFLRLYPMNFIYNRLQAFEKENFTSDNIDKIVDDAKDRLDKTLSTLNISNYSRDEIASLYESINLRENIYITLLSIENISKDIEFNRLKMSRF